MSSRSPVLALTGVAAVQSIRHQRDQLFYSITGFPGGDFQNSVSSPKCQIGETNVNLKDSQNLGNLMFSFGHCPNYVDPKGLPHSGQWVPFSNFRNKMSMHTSELSSHLNFVNLYPCYPTTSIGQKASGAKDISYTLTQSPCQGT